MRMMNKDFADRSAIIGFSSRHYGRYHYEIKMVRKGIFAALILLVMMAVLTAVTYAAQPAAPQAKALNMTVSAMSLVDDKGEE